MIKNKNRFWVVHKRFVWVFRRLMIGAITGDQFFHKLSRQLPINMINPRSLIRALDKHWDAIERIVLLGRDQLTYERDELLALLAKVYVRELAEQHIERLQHLVNAELLIEMSHSNTLQLNENVRQFAASLLHEHELGLSDILKARIIDIKTGLDQLHQAVQDRDMAALQRSAVRIDNQLRQILQ